MAPFLPVVSVSRSQNVRLGRGPGVSVVPQVLGGDQLFNVQTNGLEVLFYANLGDGNVRRDYQHHSAIGAIDSVGSLSLTTTSDLFSANAGSTPVSSGSGLSVNVSAFNLQSRTFGGVLTTLAQTNLTLAANSSGLGRVDAVCVDYAGRVFVVTGVPAAAQAYEIDTVATSGTPTGGTITLGFTYNGATYTTQPIAYNAIASAVATAVQQAANLPGTLTGSGGPLTTGTVTLTASGTALWGLSNLQVVTNALTGGTTPAATFSQSTPGVVGPLAPVVSGVSQTISTVAVANGASSPGSITKVIPTS